MQSFLREQGSTYPSLMDETGRVAIAYGVPDEAWGSALQLGINLGAIATAGILTLAVQRWLSRRRRPVARA